jgi:hypothetical protein
MDRTADLCTCKGKKFALEKVDVGKLFGGGQFQHKLLFRFDFKQLYFGFFHLLEGKNIHVGVSV